MTLLSILGAMRCDAMRCDAVLCELTVIKDDAKVEFRNLHYFDLCHKMDDMHYVCHYVIDYRRWREFILTREMRFL